MEFQTGDIEALLDKLSETTKQPLDYTGLIEMARLIRKRFSDNSFGESYIYEKVYRGGKSARDFGSPVVHGLRQSKLDVIARYLGFNSYHEFVEKVREPIDPTLESCEGSYYSYVRMNHKNPALLRSPVEIKKESGRIIWKLSGPERSYEGEMKLAAGCMFVLMTSSIGKQFHHVYRIGKKSSPKVLLGIFSGVSTGFVPIGGRVVLIRSEEPFQILSPRLLVVADMVRSKSLAERRLAEYFKDYTVNNLKVPEQMTFTINDLGSCR